MLFIAPINCDNCYLNISMLDDSNNSIAIGIKSMKCDGIDIDCFDASEFGPFSIKADQKITLDVKVDSSEYFGSEVKVICK